MRRAQEGEAEAFRLLVDEIAPVISNFLRRRHLHCGEEQDVCQEILLAIYQARHTYQPTRPLEPWLFAIAHHVAADHCRRYWTRVSWQELREGLPEEGAESTEYMNMHLRQSLTQMPPLQREAFVMLKMEGLSLTQAAERTGMSVGALKVRAHRAYEALKKSVLG